MATHLFAVFAHPDDESFGPAGALLAAAHEGTQLHLITLTAGESGDNYHGHNDLASVRLAEWRAAGKLLGATTMTHYGYPDGKLNNQTMIEAARRLKQQVADIVKDGDSYEFMAFEFGGISGHIDHIVATRAAALVYEHSLMSDRPATRLRLFCLSEEQAPKADGSRIYQAAGYPLETIDETIDACQFSDKIREIISCHQSQPSDMNARLSRPDSDLCINHFIIL